MQIIGWIGHIRILVPACFLYILSQFGSEALLNHQPLEASALFISTSLLSLGIYVLATVIRRLAIGKQKSPSFLPFLALNIVGFSIFTVVAYIFAVLMNNRCLNEPARAHVVMAVDYVHARIHTPASLKVKDWANSGAERWLSLQPNQLQQFKPPALVTVFVQPGAFGYDWLLDVMPGAQPSTTKNPNANLPPMPQAYCRIGSAILRR